MFRPKSSEGLVRKLSEIPPQKKGAQEVLVCGLADQENINEKMKAVNKKNKLPPPTRRKKKSLFKISKNEKPES